MSEQTKTYNVTLSRGKMIVENTTIPVDAKSAEVAEALALKMILENPDVGNWSDSSDDIWNYQVEEVED